MAAASPAMISVGTGAAWAAIVAASIAAITLTTTAIFKAGQMWELLRRATTLAEENQAVIEALRADLERLWRDAGRLTRADDRIEDVLLGLADPPPDGDIGDTPSEGTKAKETEHEQDEAHGR